MSSPGWWASCLAWFERRRLTRELREAETALGLHGWQAADFSQELQPTLAFLGELEEAQVAHINHHADLAAAIRDLDERESLARSEFESASAAIDARLGPALERQPDSTGEQAEAALRATAFEKALLALDQQLTALAKERDQLVHSKKLNIDGDLRRMMVRQTELRKEREDVDQQRRLWRSKRVVLGGESEAITEARRRGESERRTAQQTLLATLAKLRLERSRRLIHAAGSEREFKRIERLKAAAHLQLGRTLADNQIAPPNQPELLAIVLDRRQALAHLG